VCHDPALLYPQPSDVEFRDDNWACLDNAVPHFNFYYGELVAWGSFEPWWDDHAWGFIWDPAADAWIDNTPVPEIAFTVSMIDTPAPTNYLDDGTNDVVLTSATTHSPIWGGSALMTTQAWTYDDSTQLDSCDITIFGESDADGDGVYDKIEWMPQDVNQVPGDVYMAYALQHELGHCLGLDDEMHIQDINDSVMWFAFKPGTFAQKYQRDMDAMLFLYGD
jgi:hypothetical protein